MKSFKFLLTLAMFTCTSASPQPAEEPCAPVHIIVARASTEAKGYGVTGILARALVKAIPGATSEPVDYPAVLSPYFQSEAAGVRAAKKLLTDYVIKCPNSKIVLSGYSQGSDVVCL
jgi:acetylxylan esterase